MHAEKRIRFSFFRILKFRFLKRKKVNTELSKYVECTRYFNFFTSEFCPENNVPSIGSCLRFDPLSIISVPTHIRIE